MQAEHDFGRAVEPGDLVRGRGRGGVRDGPTLTISLTLTPTLSLTLALIPRAHEVRRDLVVVAVGGRAEVTHL